MSREETKIIIAHILSAYPNYKPENLEYTLELWYSMLADYPLNVVEFGLKAFICTDTKGFAPSVGQVIQKIESCKPKEETSDLEAWSRVRKAISNGYYNYVEEYNKLPEDIQKAVGNARNIREWAIMDQNTVDSVIQSQFLKSYRTATERRKEIEKLPADMQKMISSVAKQLSIEG